MEISRLSPLQSGVQCVEKSKHTMVAWPRHFVYHVISLQQNIETAQVTILCCGDITWRPHDVTPSSMRRDPWWPRMNIDATRWRRIDVRAASFRSHVPVRMLQDPQIQIIGANMEDVHQTYGPVFFSPLSWCITALILFELVFIYIYIENNLG